MMRSLKAALSAIAVLFAIALPARAAPGDAIDGYVAAAPLHAVPAAPLVSPAISWRVENPFRFFTDPADTEVHRATYNALSPEERAKPVLAAERALGARQEEGWAASMYRKTCWNWAASLFECPPGHEQYINPKSHTVVVELKGMPEAQAASTVECAWTISPKGAKQNRGEPVTQSCAEPIKFDIPYPDGADIAVEIGGVEVAKAGIRVRDLLIAAMGDSFGSGEGNPDIPVRFSRERYADYGKATDEDMTGFPVRVGPWKQIGDKDFIDENARWLDQACHRSLYSHQLRAALQLAVEEPHRAVTFVGVACSGSEVVPGLFLRYKGNEWVPRPPELSQISALAQAQCGTEDAPMQDLPEAYHMSGKIPDLQGGLVLRKCEPQNSRKIDLLFVSIGGNDIGFARLVANAVLADESKLKQLGGWFGQVFGPSEATTKIAGLDARYKSLNRAVHNILHIPWEQSDRVILTAYPGMAMLDDGKRVCPDGQAGMEVLPEFKLSAKKTLEAEKVADKLNGVMKKAANTYGWSFVDSHRPDFVGRGLCAGFTDNAMSVADDLRLPRRVASEWVPYNPADFQAYAPRQRWFRTPNDAFMTGNFHVSAGLMQKVLKLESVSFVQVLLAATYSGAFHPTAEGHAAIADAAAARARQVLAKYGRGS
ncbi:MAG: hypothetical protein ABL901_17580 [Hyphomicrobiaceae bacterium]